MARLVIPDDEPSVIAPSAAFQRITGWDLQVYDSRPASAAELLERIRDAEFVINVRTTTRFTREVLGACAKLKLISIWGTGTDNIDLAAAREFGIRVTNTPGVSARSVAEHALTLILAVARSLVRVDAQVRQGKWPRAMVTQIQGKTLGLIGTGAIGRELARLAKGIGLNVIAWTFHPSGDVAEWVSFDDIFRRSDVVSVHLRQSPETTAMIGREHFAMMKPGSIFINTARGAIVRESDLIEALQSGRIGGAGLDVFEMEPLPPNSPFFLLPNVVLTPHSAGITPEATEAGIALAIDNIVRFIDGHPSHVVV
jgi:D-3-phosphoglycerate dehydrogenase